MYKDAAFHSVVIDVCEKNGVSVSTQLFPIVPTMATAIKTPTSCIALPRADTRLRRSNSVSLQPLRGGWW